MIRRIRKMKDILKLLGRELRELGEKVTISPVRWLFMEKAKTSSGRILKLLIILSIVGGWCWFSIIAFPMIPPLAAPLIGSLVLIGVAIALVPVGVLMEWIVFGEVGTYANPYGHWERVLKGKRK